MKPISYQGSIGAEPEIRNSDVGKITIIAQFINSEKYDMNLEF